MTVTALHLRTDGTWDLFEYDPIKDYEVLKEKVGGWLEAAPVTDRRTTMYCNEEGKLLGLPPNPKATALLRTPDVIAGDVVLTGAPDEEGYDTSLPEILISALREGG